MLAAITAIAAANPRSLGARKLRRFVPKPRLDKDGSPLPVTVSNEISSIRSTAETQTAVLDSENLLVAMETDAPPFNLAELATDTVSLFVVLPVDKLVTHGRWLRLILTLCIRILARQRRPPAQPVLFILDEMGTIGNLAMVEQSYGLMAGLNIRIWGFLQDLAQLQHSYPAWETFWSNSSIIQILNCGDLTTSEHVSRYLGTATVNSKTGGWSYKQVRWPDGQNGYYAANEQAVETARRNHTQSMTKQQLEAVHPGSGVSTLDDLLNRAYVNSQDKQKAEGKTAAYNTTWVPDEQLASRPVLYPNEVRDSDPGRSILIRPGRGNYRLERYEYFSDPVLSGRARHDPNKPAPIVKAPALPIAPAPIAAAPPVSYETMPALRPMPPAPKPAPQSVGDELADLGKDLGKKAAGAAFSFLKDRINR